MTLITARLQGQHKAPDGKVTAIDSATALFQRGPIMQVILHPNAAFVAALTAANKPIPQPISGLALIDTGATKTCIDRETVETMGLASNGVAKMSSASHHATDCLTYPIRLHFAGWNINIDCEKAIAVETKKQGIIALVGRDLLRKCLFVYNGADGSFSLAV